MSDAVSREIQFGEIGKALKGIGRDRRQRVIAYGELLKTLKAEKGAIGCSGRKRKEDVRQKTRYMRLWECVFFCEDDYVYSCVKECQYMCPTVSVCVKCSSECISVCASE